MNFKGTIEEVQHHDGLATIYVAGDLCPELIVENPPADFRLEGAIGLAIAGVGNIISVEGVPVADRRGNGCLRWRRKRNAAVRESRP